MLKRLLSETAIYGLSSILGRLVNYLLIPIHTGIIAPNGYGIISIFYSWAAVLNILYTYGMETAYFRHVGKEGVEEKSAFNAAFSSLAVTSLLFSSLLIGFSPDIARAMGYQDSQQYIIWFALILAADNISVIPFARLRHQKKPIQFAFIRLSNIGLNVLLNIFFFIVCPKIVSGEWMPALQDFVNSFYDPELGLGYAFFANLLASLALLPMLLPTYIDYRPKIDWSLLQSMYKYAYPIIFSGLFYTVNEVVDRILIEHWLPAGFYEGVDSQGAVGIYAACYKLSIFISLAVQAYKYAAEPFFFSTGKDTPAILARSMTYFVLALTLMFMAVSLNLEWIGQTVIRQEEYWAGLGVVPILLMANLFLGIYYNLAFWFKLTDKTYYGALISGGGALITLTANLILIPIIGYFGSAIATLLCYGSMTAISYLLGKKHMDVPYQVGKILGYLAVAIAFVALAFWLDIQGPLKWIVQNLMLVLYLAWVVFREKSAFASNKHSS